MVAAAFNAVTAGNSPALGCAFVSYVGVDLCRRVCADLPIGAGASAGHRTACNKFVPSDGFNLATEALTRPIGLTPNKSKSDNQQAPETLSGQVKASKVDSPGHRGLLGDGHPNFYGDFLSVLENLLRVANAAKVAARKVFHCGWSAIFKTKRIRAFPIRLGLQCLCFVSGDKTFHDLDYRSFPPMTASGRFPLSVPIGTSLGGV